MNLDFKGKLPIPKQVKRKFPVSEAALEIKKQRDEEIKNVFDRFYKTDKSRSEDKKGVGLGMSFAKNIINLHKQKIWVESIDAKEGSDVKFTHFTFTLELS